ncbi:hypothetical protein [Nocardioides sp.]|uniref:hypothetical protein n=1 Tax=Nocardioides sp. TaxID=35761 RepID=UPI0035171E44
MSDDYSADLADYASTRTKNVKAASRALREACIKAAATNDSHAQIARRIRETLMDAGQAEPKGTASKVATVALWLRAGGSWPEGGSLTSAYESATLHKRLNP